MCVNISISLLRFSVIILLGITIIHSLATVFYWYWSIHHFDTIMHVIGGFWLLVFFSALFLGDKTQEYIHIINQKKWIIIAGIISSILGWEMIEWFFDTFVYRQNIWQLSVGDSIKDISFGLIGALLAYFFIRFKFKN